MGKVKVGVGQSNALGENTKSSKKTKKYKIIGTVAIGFALGIFVNYFNKNYIYTV